MIKFVFAFHLKNKELQQIKFKCISRGRFIKGFFNRSLQNDVINKATENALQCFANWIGQGLTGSQKMFHQKLLATPSQVIKVYTAEKHLQY